MSNYLIESSICLAVFYSFYWVALHREKLLNINRFYLLASVIVSLAIPFLTIRTNLSLFQASNTTNTLVASGSEQLANPQSTPIITIGTLYLIGLAIAFGILLVKLVILRRKLGPSFSLRKKHIEIAEIEGKEAFSFFNTIYIGKELSENRYLKEQVIAHEFAHIDGKHTLDTLFFELLKCFYWFNPFSYFYSQSAQLQHEFIADQFALKKSNTEAYERSLLQLTLMKINPSLVASFNQHPIQKRLKMMKTINSNIMKRLKPLFALPVLGALVIALACTEEVSPESNEIVFEETEIPYEEALTPEAENVKTRIKLRIMEVKESLPSQKTINGKVVSYNVPLIQETVHFGLTKITEQELQGNTIVLGEEEEHLILHFEKPANSKKPYKEEDK